MAHESRHELYHEKQLSAMCGVHALNNLLQGPYFGAGDLAEVAHHLDAEEHALLGGPSGLASHRVDLLTGDFNIEVLAAALQRHGVELINADHAAVAERVSTAPQDEEAFLLHMSAHWLTLRKLGGMWWNIDSRLERPRLVPHDALLPALARHRADGQAVFVVQPGAGSDGRRHSLPPPLRRADSNSVGREEV